MPMESNPFPLELPLHTRQTNLNGLLKFRREEDNLHREGFAQQSSKSVCHSPYPSEPLIESRPCPDETEEFFLQQKKSISNSMNHVA